MWGSRTTNIFPAVAPAINWSTPSLISEPNVQRQAYWLDIIIAAQSFGSPGNSAWWQRKHNAVQQWSARDGMRCQVRMDYSNSEGWGLVDTLTCNGISIHQWPQHASVTWEEHAKAGITAWQSCSNARPGVHGSNHYTVQNITVARKQTNIHAPSKQAVVADAHQGTIRIYSHDVWYIQDPSKSDCESEDLLHYIKRKNKSCCCSAGSEEVKEEVKEENGRNPPLTSSLTSSLATLQQLISFLRLM